MVKQVFKVFKNLKNPFYSPVPPQPGLEPVMGDVYRSPTPSPDNYDKGNIFTNPPIPRVDIVYDGCNVGLQVNPSYFLAKYPPIQIVYRNPECILPPPPKTDWFKGLNLSGCERWSIWIVRTYKRVAYIAEDGYREYRLEASSVNEFLVNFREYNRQAETNFLDGASDEEILTYIDGTGFERRFQYGVCRFGIPLYAPFYADGTAVPPRTGFYPAVDYVCAPGVADINYPAKNGQDVINALQTIFALPFPISVAKIDPPAQPNNCPLTNTPPPPDPPPPPPMTCNCCPNIQQNDELLRLILKRIGEPKTVTIFDEDMEREGAQQANKEQETLFNAAKIATDRVEIANRLIGIANYPVKVPDTMIAPHKEGIFEQVFDFIDGDKEREIKTVTELITWMAEQDSAVLGQFHQVIEFEQDFDGDGNTKSETVVLPNVAESLKEMILLLVQLANAEGTKLHALVKILAEVNNLKVNLFKTMQTVIDIQDYLDYPTNTKQVEVPLSCTFKLDDRQDLEEFFNDSKGKMTFEDWDGTNSLHDNMLDLMQIAAMLRTMLYQRD